MARHKRDPAPAGTPGTGWVEIEAGSPFLNPPHSSEPAPGEAFAAAWLARLGVRPALAATVVALARLGGAA